MADQRLTRLRRCLAAVVLLAVSGGRTAGQPAGLAEAAQALREQRFRDAHEKLQPLLAAQRADARLWTLDGMALAGMRRTGESLKAYDRALAANPDYLPALLGKAELQYRAGDKSAPATLSQVLRLDPGNATAHAMLGSLAAERGDCAAALPHFDEGRQQALKTRAGAWQYGQCLLTEGRPTEAVALFQQIVDAGTSGDLARFNLALALYQAGRYRESIEALGPLARREPPASEVLGLLAAAYGRERNIGEAIATLRGAIELYPREEAHYLDLGALCAEHKAFELGTEVLGVAARNLPSSSAVRVLRGMLFAQQGKFREAETEFDEADRLSPTYAAIGSAYASLFRGSEDLERSIAKLREEVISRPADAVLSYLLGEALMRTRAQPGEPAFEEAQKALELAVALKPDFAKAHSALGTLYWRADRAADAIRELETAIKLDPADQFATYRLAMALNAAGRERDAGTLVRKLRQLKEEERRTEEANRQLRLIKPASERSNKER